MSISAFVGKRGHRASKGGKVDVGPRLPDPASRLRGLRRLCGALVVASAVVLPFEFGVAPVPNLARLPVVGRFFGPATPAIDAVTNYPYTAVVGHGERVSVQLLNLPHARLVYELHYPNGRVARGVGIADAQGHGSYTFRITGYRPRRFREEAYISVTDATHTVAGYTHFAIQQDRPLRGRHAIQAWYLVHSARQLWLSVAGR